MDQSQQETTPQLHRKFWTNPLTVLFGAVTLFLLSEITAVVVLSLAGLSLESVTNATLFFYSLVKLLSFGWLLAVVQRLLKFSWRGLGFSRPTWKAVFSVLPVFAIYVVISGILMFLATRLIPGFDVEQTQNIGFKDVAQTRELIMTGATLVLVVPLVEELLFRGVLFHGLRRRLPFWLSTIVVSVVFAAAHGQWNVAVDTFALSIILCWLTERSRSVVPAILLHMLKNAIAFTILFVV